MSSAKRPDRTPPTVPRSERPSVRPLAAPLFRASTVAAAIIVKNRFAIPLAILLAVVSAVPALRAQAASVPTATAPAPAAVVEVFEWRALDGAQRWGPGSLLGHAPRDTNVAPRLLFRGLPSDEWRPGQVPLFAGDRDGQPVLRRRPPPGEEPFAEPLCLVLPSLTEARARPDAAPLALAGTWRCTATRVGGSEAWFTWQLTVDASTDVATVAGRFDPGSDYRVATFKGGTCRSNQIAFAVEYAGDTYELTGRWRPEGGMDGVWTKGDGSERGAWQANRQETTPLPLPAGAPVELIEWRHPASGRRHYTLGPTPEGAGWQRTGAPLGRVWPPSPSPDPSVVPTTPR